MANSSVKLRISAALFVFVLFTAGMAGLSFYGISEAAYLLSRTEQSYQQLDVLGRLSSDLNQYFLRHVEGLVLGPNGDAARQSARGMARHFEDLRRLTEIEISLVRSDSEKGDEAAELERLDEIRSVIAALMTEAAINSRLAETGRREEAVRHFSEILTGSLGHTLSNLLAEATQDERDEVAGADQRAVALRERLLWLGATVILLHLLMAAVLAVQIGRSILAPLASLVGGIKTLGRGQLSHRIRPGGCRDEFALLAAHINRMARHLERHRDGLLRSNRTLEAEVARQTASLTEMNRQLRDIDATRKRFFEDVSHELRTPLTTIVGEAEVTLSGTPDMPDTCRAALHAILANAGYLRRRVEDLMAIARSDNGRLELRRDPLELHDVVTEAVADVAGLARVNTIGLSYEGSRTTVPIVGERSWLKQCLLTVLDNAIKFSRRGQSVTVTLEARQGEALLSVRDMGTGIPPAELPHLFERFYQTEGGRRRGGTGLGLAVARWIVKEHNGAICAHNGDGAGTVIEMRFPLDQGRCDEPAAR